MKNFDAWNLLKKATDIVVPSVDFHGREIWWCRFGVNIGSEQNGRGDNFERPIVIIKKLSPSTFLCAPLSTKQKLEKYQSEINTSAKGYSLLDQIKVLDSRRLVRKISMVDESEFENLMNKFKNIYS